MSLDTLLVRPVTILTAGTRTDAYGDTQPDWNNPTSVFTLGWLAQVGSVQDLNGRDATSTNLSLTLQSGTVITAQDKVKIDGRTYEVAAEPVSAWTPRGEHHVECYLRVVTG